MRALLALGGNAMTNPDGRARPEDQIAAARVAADATGAYGTVVLPEPPAASSPPLDLTPGVH